MLSLIRIFCVLLAFSVPVSAVHAAGAVDEHGKGPKIGAQIPHDLALPDQNGQRLDFMARARAKGLIILFSRSVGW